MVKVAVFGDHFVRASILERSLNKHLSPLLGKLEFASCEFDYPMGAPSSDSEIREYHGTPAEVVELASDAQVIICHMPPLSKNVLRQLTKLRAIGCTRTEPVNINVRAATEAGIPVFYAPGRNARAVAEFTVGLIISECRNIARGHQSLASGVWRGDLYLYDRAPRELNGQTIGLIGFGNIGSMMPNLLKPISRRGTGTLCWRIGGNPIGMVRFDLSKLDQQLVIFQIADDRRVQYMIAMVMVVDLGLELFIARAQGFVGHE